MQTAGANMTRYVIDVLKIQHAVPDGDIAQLKHWFGPALPAGVEGPQDLLQWMISHLPWTSIHPMLQRRMDALLVAADETDNICLKCLAMQLVDRPSRTLMPRVFAAVAPAAHAHVRWVNGGVVDSAGAPLIGSGRSLTPKTRLWMFATLLLQAVEACIRGLGADQEMVDWSLQAILLGSSADIEENHEARDLVVREIAAALAAYTRTWAGGWKPQLQNLPGSAKRR